MRRPPGRRRSRSSTGSSGRRSRSRAPPGHGDGRWRLGERVVRRRRVYGRPAGRAALAVAAVAATRRRAARRCAGPWPPRASRPGAAGPPATSSIAWQWPSAAVERLDLGHRVPEGAQASAIPAAKRGSSRTSIGGGEVLLRLDEPARRADGRRDVHARRRRAPTRPGRGSGAGRRRPSSRPRPTAGRPGTASRGAACGAVRLPGASSLAWPSRRVKNDAPVRGSGCPVSGSSTPEPKPM